MGETEILKEVLRRLTAGIFNCKHNKERRILREIKEYIESEMEVTEKWLGEKPMIEC